MEKLKNVVIIGAGPAGLTAGFELIKKSHLILKFVLLLNFQETERENE